MERSRVGVGKGTQHRLSKRLCTWATVIAFIVIVYMHAHVDASRVEDGHELYADDTGTIDELTTANWNATVTTDQWWMIEFYAHWCGHCQRFAPEFRQLATSLGLWRPSLRVGAIDCASSSHSTCLKYGVHGFPSILLFSPVDPSAPSRLNGETAIAAEDGEDREHTKFTGHRESDNIKAWLAQHIPPPPNFIAVDVSPYHASHSVATVAITSPHHRGATPSTAPSPSQQAMMDVLPPSGETVEALPLVIDEWFEGFNFTMDQLVCPLTKGDKVPFESKAINMGGNPLAVCTVLAWDLYSEAVPVFAVIVDRQEDLDLSVGGDGEEWEWKVLLHKDKNGGECARGDGNDDDDYFDDFDYFDDDDFDDFDDFDYFDDDDFDDFDYFDDDDFDDSEDWYGDGHCGWIWVHPLVDFGSPTLEDMEVSVYSSLGLPPPRGVGDSGGGDDAVAGSSEWEEEERGVDVEDKSGPRVIPTVDIEAAISNSMHREVVMALFGDLSLDVLSGLAEFLTSLNMTFPRVSALNETLHFVNDKLEQQSLTIATFSRPFHRELSGWRYSSRDNGFSDPDYDVCEGSKQFYRGYPCSLWLLFHTILAKAPCEGDHDRTTFDALLSVRHYVKNFLGCKECALNFVEMSAELEDINANGILVSESSNHHHIGDHANARLMWRAQLTEHQHEEEEETRRLRHHHHHHHHHDDERRYFLTKKESVLWLWRAHNKVNHRLFKDLSSDPEHPKVQFPPLYLCPSCRVVADDRDDVSSDGGDDKGGMDIEWDEDEVYEFLLRRHNITYSFP